MSVASAVAQRYRDADTIQAQRVAAKPRDFAAALTVEPSVISGVGRQTLAPPQPGRLATDAAVPPRPVARSVLPSPALARRSATAYESAASLGQPSGSPVDAAAPSGSSLSIEC